jgi:hypothetical protein
VNWVWIIQSFYDGIPECPDVFTEEAQAWVAWTTDAPTDTWEDGYYTDEHHVEMRLFHVVMDGPCPCGTIDVEARTCAVSDCPTEGPVNEHGVCAACFDAMACSCGSGLPVSDEDWMKGCCEECYGSWAEGIREHFKGASE